MKGGIGRGKEEKGIPILKAIGISKLELDVEKNWVFKNAKRRRRK
jgi:hypothetical protein